MRILVVAATDGEVAPLAAALGNATREQSRLRVHTLGAHEVHVLVTGVGMVATAAWCARTLSESPYALALNLGVCGSFTPKFPPGAVVHVVSDRLVELGAEDGDRFLTLDQLGLTLPDPAPCDRALLVNVSPPVNRALLDLPVAVGITVNTAHGRESSIAGVVERFAPQVESMEGAAFMYACLIHQVPFAQVRAVSNVVERRNRSAWRMAEAIDRLGAAALKILADL